jgi:hypothetical protein
MKLKKKLITKIQKNTLKHFFLDFVNEKNVILIYIYIYKKIRLNLVVIVFKSSYATQYTH